MNPSIFNFLDNKNLSLRLIIVKKIGQLFMIVAIIGFTVFQYSGGDVAGTPLLSMVPGLVTWSLIGTIVCFAIVALAASGKTKSNSTAQAMGQSLRKVSLYIYLPAFIIAIILVGIFVVPRYL